MVLRRGDGQGVVLRGQLVLAHMLEADGQVVKNVGIVLLRVVGPEVGLLGLVPAALAGVEISERE